MVSKIWTIEPHHLASGTASGPGVNPHSVRSSPHAVQSHAVPDWLHVQGLGCMLHVVPTLACPGWLLWVAQVPVDQGRSCVQHESWSGWVSATCDMGPILAPYGHCMQCCPGAARANTMCTESSTGGLMWWEPWVQASTLSGPTPIIQPMWPDEFDTQKLIYHWTGCM